MIDVNETLASVLNRTPYRIAVIFNMFDQPKHREMAWFDNYDLGETVEDLIHAARKRIVLGPTRTFLDSLVPNYGSVVMEWGADLRIIYFTVNTRQKTIDELIIEREPKIIHGK